MNVNYESGLAIKRPYLQDRQITPYSEVQHLTRSKALVKIVDLDTAKPGGTIYEKMVIDTLNGSQSMKLLSMSST